MSRNSFYLMTLPVNESKDFFLSIHLNEEPELWNIASTTTDDKLCSYTNNLSHMCEEMLDKFSAFVRLCFKLKRPYSSAKHAVLCLM